MQAETHHRESEFHDEWAASTPVESVRVRETFESATAVENRWILKRMGNLRGVHLLDIGCGLGESSVYFALQGAEVTATDLSPGMVEFAARLARHYGTALRTVVTAGESLAGVETAAYDVVYIANTIHHVTDKGALYEEISRVLKPGGRFFSWDPVAYNPVINRYRAMAMEVRTEEEAPLRKADLHEIRRHFPGAEARFFWMTSLALFLKYYLLDRVNPNADRYWKRIYQPQPLWWWRPLATMDGMLCRVPGLRWLSWNVVITGKKAR